MKLDAVIDWYSTLTPETVSKVGEIYHEDAQFRDPFNSVRGHRAIRAIFQHMFEATNNPVFRIVSAQTEDDTAWVSWTFEFQLYGKEIAIEGVTRLDFGHDGRVIVHRDYWDASELLVEIPLLGRLLRFLKRRLSVQDRVVETRAISQ